MENLNPTMLQYARYTIIGAIVMMFGQASTGLSQSSADTGQSHVWTAQIGLLLCVLTVVFVMMSKTDDSKVKGMSWGLLMAWVIQYGLGELYANGTSSIAYIHAVIAMAILLHAMALLKSIPAGNE